MPVTWDHSGQVIAPGSSSTSLQAASSSGHIPVSTPEVADLAHGFEPADFDAEGVRTIAVAPAYELRPRFTGRSGALAQLHELTSKAYDHRELGFAVVIGEPGMGKTRLINELAARIRTEHPTTRLFHGIADENSHAYGPVARALTARFDIVAGEEPAVSRDRLSTELADVVDSERLPEVAHLIAHLLRVPFEDSPIVTPIAGSPQRLEARLFMALKRFFAAESERYPLLIVIENLEQCGQDTINFVQYIAAGLRDHRVCVIATATAALHDKHPAFGDGDNAPVRLEIGALSPNEAEDLLRELCKQLQKVPTLLTEHVRTMPGSPRAIYELVRLLLETNSIVREPTGWRIDDAALGALVLPTT
jgi:predicted ATPase